MRTFAWIIPGAAMALLTSVAGAQNPPPPPVPDRPLVTVTAVGEAQAVPDEVLITVGVEALAESVAAARQQTNGRAAKIIATARQHGVEEKDIQTDRVNLYPDYEYREPGRRHLLGYRSTQTLAILLRDVSEYEPLLDDLLQIPLDRLDGIEWRTSQLDALRDQARRRAMQTAQASARTLAEGAGQHVGAAFSITEEPTVEAPPIPLAAMRMEAGAGGREPAVAPGQITVRTRVTVAFELERPDPARTAGR